MLKQVAQTDCGISNFGGAQDSRGDSPEQLAL